MSRTAWWRKPAIWPAVAGYFAGLATAGVIALLVPGASPHGGTASPAATTATSSRPVPADPTATTAAVPAAEIPQHAATPLSPEARQRIAPLEERLAAEPGDLQTRKRLAVALLQSQQLMLAYEHASQILAAAPDDPDGLYVHGVVRLAMGHAPHAIELLDRVLARYPDHALALRARADAQRKIGDESGASMSEARALEAERADGSEVEQLLAAASDGSLLQMMRSDSGAAPDAEGGAGGG